MINIIANNSVIKNYYCPITYIVVMISISVAICQVDGF